MSKYEKFKVYVCAYGRHFFRTALWVTLVCVALFGVLLMVPQAGELILSQATWPAAKEEAAGSFISRLLFLNMASAMLAVSIWLSAHLLVKADLDGQKSADVLAREGYVHDPQVPLPSEKRQLEIRAAKQAAIYVPRQLGLAVFLILQLAAAGSISMQGYWLPVALTLVWVFVLMMGLLRLDDVVGGDLRAWWKGLLAVVLLMVCVAIALDWIWLASRELPMVRAVDDTLDDVKWLQEQTFSVLVMGGFALAICVLLLSLTPWITDVNDKRGRTVQSWASVGAWVLIIMAFALAGLLTWRDLYWVFFALQSLLAICYWLMLVHGHKLLHLLNEEAANRFDSQAGARATTLKIEKARTFTRAHIWSLTGGLIALITLVLAVWAEFSAATMGGYLGAVGILLMFLAYFVLVVAWAQARIEHSKWQMTVPAGFVGMLLLAGFFLWPTNPQSPPEQVPGQANAGASVTVQQSLENLPDQGPVFAIAAHGGGIRAAQYTASFLAWMDHETGYQFSDRLVAASGASGGSVGLAVWAAARAAGCKDQGLVGKARIPACVNAVNETLVQDHLSPLIASGLFRDYLQFLREPARGNALQQSIVQAAAQVPVAPGKNLASELRRGLPEASVALMLNASTVGTAHPLSFVTRVDMLPVEPEGIYVSYVKSTSTASISLISAAMHSARFPLISPKGRVVKGGDAVVDGGYFDNSGAAVLRQHILSLEDNPAYDKYRAVQRLIVISVDSEPIGSNAPEEPGDARNSIGEIVGTIVAARGAHGSAAWRQMCEDLDSGRLLSARPGAPLWRNCEWPTDGSQEPGSPQLWKRQRVARAPALGWYLSARSAARVSSDAREKATEIANLYHLKRSVPGPAKGIATQRMAD